MDKKSTDQLVQAIGWPQVMNLSCAILQRQVSWLRKVSRDPYLRTILLGSNPEPKYRAGGRPRLWIEAFYECLHTIGLGTPEDKGNPNEEWFKSALHLLDTKASIKPNGAESLRMIEPITDTLKCNIGSCAKRFKTVKGLNQHIRLSHRHEDKKAAKTQPKIIYKDRAGREVAARQRKWMCPGCGPISTRSGLTRHKCQGKAKSDQWYPYEIIRP